jgi:cellulose synthase/poly-beta-1,6-N-acetylglucosamine synthase-like glycosyltransferase
LLYWYLLALGSLRRRRVPPSPDPSCRFAIAIPAHDEGTVIGSTVATLRALDYPAELFDVYVVADHCTDQTASIARQAGAQCFERTSGPRTGKGAALGWLFERIWETGIPYDDVVVFDADTQVDAGFLRAMAARLSQGDQVVQGQHRISNPRDGWFPALMWAMFTIDNRFQNMGRANLGFSAKNMGDSICLQSSVLRQIGWGEGLTEDYDLRLRLLLEGIRIAYEPSAIGCGQAAATWASARRQRERWLVGVRHSKRRHLSPLLRLTLRCPTGALMDGLAQIVFPPYSTLAVISALAVSLQLAANLAWSRVIPAILLWSWTGVLCALVLYPFLGLTLERAPWRAYLVIWTGPVFVLWRTWLAVRSRLWGRSVRWVRTPRRVER